MDAKNIRRKAGTISVAVSGAIILGVMLFSVAAHYTNIVMIGQKNKEVAQIKELIYVCEKELDELKILGALEASTPHDILRLPEDVQKIYLNFQDKLIRNAPYNDPEFKLYSLFLYNFGQMLMKNDNTVFVATEGFNIDFFSNVRLGATLAYQSLKYWYLPMLNEKLSKGEEELFYYISTKDSRLINPFSGN